MTKDFEMLPHTADIKIRVYGIDRKQLFPNALVAMFQVLEPRAPGCRKVEGRLVCDMLPAVHELAIEAGDITQLMVDFLSEAIYLSDIHNQAYLAARVHEITDTFIRATIYGVSISRFEVVEIKAVTYHELVIEQVNNGWIAEIVFDI